MENKIIEFIREFNTSVEDKTDFGIQYTTTGNSSAIFLSEIYLWDNNNYSEESFKTQSAVTLVKTLKPILEQAEEMLLSEVDKWLLDLKGKLKEKYPKIVAGLFRKSNLLLTPE